MLQGVKASDKIRPGVLEISDITIPLETDCSQTVFMCFKPSHKGNLEDLRVGPSWYAEFICAHFSHSAKQTKSCQSSLAFQKMLKNSCDDT